MDTQSIRKTCRCPVTRCYKKSGLGPPPAPRNKHNKFQYTAPSHIKSCTSSFGGDRGPRQKARRFVTEDIRQRKHNVPKPPRRSPSPGKLLFDLLMLRKIQNFLRCPAGKHEVNVIFHLRMQSVKGVTQSIPWLSSDSSILWPLANHLKSIDEA